MGVIYKIYNDFNDKVYIGKTTRDAQTRFLEHYKQKDGSQSHINSSMAKHGLEHYNYEIIEECPNENLSEQERYWIAFYNSLEPNGYNMTPGGDGSSLTDKQIQDIRQKWEEGFAIREIEEQLGIPRSTIYHRICKYEDFDAEENRKRSMSAQYRPITKYNKNGDKICDYESITAAALDLGTNTKGFAEAIQKNHLLKGYYFTYKDEPLIITTNKKKVMQFDLCGNYLQTFEGARAAGRELGMDSAGIIKACNGKNSSSKGFIFIYEADYNEEILKEKVQAAKDKAKRRKKEYQ